jgi:hypothetical protein
VLLPGIPVSAQQMWDAVKGRAKGRVRFEPDPALQKIMDAVPKETVSKKAQSLGFRGSASIQEIVDEYEKDHSDTAVARHG